jgi:F-type H+-transporting ATPase subunit b
VYGKKQFMSLKQVQRILLVIAALLICFPNSSIASSEQAAVGEELIAEAEMAVGSAQEPEAKHGGGHLNWFDYSNKEAPPLAILIFNFICLVIIVYFIVRKSLGQRFKNRKTVLEAAIKEAADMKAKAEKALAAARAKSEALDSEMAKLRGEITEAGKSERAQILEDAEKQSKRLRADAKIMVEQEVARIAQAIREEVVTEMVSMAGQRVQEKIERSDHDRLANDYLDGMTSTSKPPADEPAS